MSRRPGRGSQSLRDDCGCAAGSEASPLDGSTTGLVTLPSRLPPFWLVGGGLHGVPFGGHAGQLPGWCLLMCFSAAVSRADVHRLRSEGPSVRQIAARLGMSRMKVHRWLTAGPGWDGDGDGLALFDAGQEGGAVVRRRFGSWGWTRRRRA